MSSPPPPPNWGDLLKEFGPLKDFDPVKSGAQKISDKVLNTTGVTVGLVVTGALALLTWFTFVRGVRAINSARKAKKNQSDKAKKTTADLKKKVGEVEGLLSATSDGLNEATKTASMIIRRNRRNG